MAEDAALRFAERLLALLDATRYSATYKLATLLALIDVTVERTGLDGTALATLPAKEPAGDDATRLANRLRDGVTSISPALERAVGDG